MNRLDKDEQEILDAFDAGELQRTPDIKDRKARHQQYAEAMFKKDARINIRLSSKDLRGCRKKRWLRVFSTRHLLPASSTSMSKVACVRIGS